MTRNAAMFALLGLTLAGVAEAGEDRFASSLERLRALAGEWEGSFEWSGARTGKGAMKATYYLTGNGSAVVENLIVDDVPVMTSVYHADGADLRLTHFCGAQNQPRLKASRIDEGEGAIDFSFVDVTNVRAPSAPHVEGLEVRFLGADRIRLTFTFIAEAGPSEERIELARIQR